MEKFKIFMLLLCAKIRFFVYIVLNFYDFLSLQKCWNFFLSFDFIDQESAFFFIIFLLITLIQMNHFDRWLNMLRKRQIDIRAKTDDGFPVWNGPSHMTS